MERGGGRSQEERAAAAEARERSRIAREEGVPLEDEEEPQRGGGWSGPDLSSISRYGGADIYARRRLIAIAGVVVVVLIIVLLLFGC